MKIVYYVYLCDDDTGEVEAMFDESGEMLGTWSNNDANWRCEYFNPFMAKLGIEVTDIDPEDRPDLVNKMTQYWKEY